MKKNIKSKSQSSQTASPASSSETQKLSPLEQNNLKHQSQPLLNAPKLKLARSLSLPLFSIGHTPLITAKILAPIFTGDMSLGDFGEAESKPELCHIINYETSQEGFLICNAVIKSTLEKVDGGYVGKYFQFRDGGKREGKRYRTVEISLMEEE